MSDINLGDLPKYFPGITFEEINACERLKEYYWGTKRNSPDSICYGSATFLVANEWMEYTWDNLTPFLKWLQKKDLLPMIKILAELWALPCFGSMLIQKNTDAKDPVLGIVTLYSVIQ